VNDKYRGTTTYVHVLGEISEDEVRAGRSMLSAVAVNVAGHAGPGFLALARGLGRLEAQADEATLWERE
jgi:hypothetical protein